MAKLPLEHTNGATRALPVIVVVAVLSAGLTILATKTKRDDVVEQATCDATCVERVALETARVDGAAAAVAYVQTAVTENPSLAIACHDIMHAVGAEAGKTGFPKYEADSCQYGYLHGVLQARAEAGDVPSPATPRRGAGPLTAAIHDLKSSVCTGSGTGSRSPLAATWPNRCANARPCRTHGSSRVRTGR